MHLLTLFWKSPHVLLIQIRQTCFDRNECTLLACDVGIIWPFTHMGIALAQGLTLLEDGVGRVRRQFLVSYRSVRSWLWSEQLKRSIGCARSGPEIRQGRWAHPCTLLEGVRGNSQLGTRVCLKAVARVTSTVRESVKRLSNNNNPEYLLNFLRIMLTAGQLLILWWKRLWIYTFNMNKKFEETWKKVLMKHRMQTICCLFSADAQHNRYDNQLS